MSAIFLLHMLLSTVGCSNCDRSATESRDSSPAEADRDAEDAEESADSSHPDLTEDQTDLAEQNDVIFESPNRRDTQGPHKITIERSFKNQREAQRIIEAERVCPDQVKVRQAIAGLSTDPALIPGPEQRCLWWMSGPQGLKLPFAVTERALAYYVEQIESFRREDFSVLNDSRLASSQLTYRASYEERDVFMFRNRIFSDVELVRLELSWAHFDTDLSAFGFFLIRSVVFPADGDPIALNDGGVVIW